MWDEEKGVICRKTASYLHVTNSLSVLTVFYP